MKHVEATQRAATESASIARGDVLTVIRDPKRPLGKRFVLDAEFYVVTSPPDISSLSLPDTLPI